MTEPENEEMKEGKAMKDKITVEIPKDTIYTINNVEYRNGEVVKKIERYRNFDVECMYFASGDKAVSGPFKLTNLETLLPPAKTVQEVHEIIKRHMAGEELKVLIAEYQDKIEPTWEADFTSIDYPNYRLYYCLERKKIIAGISWGTINNQKEFYCSREVAYCQEFLEKAEPLFKKWIGVE